jgi:hypothetical protein
MPNEADTCRKFVMPKLQAAGRDRESHPIAEQRCFANGWIISDAGELGTAVNPLQALLYAA